MRKIAHPIYGVDNWRELWRTDPNDERQNAAETLTHAVWDPDGTAALVGLSAVVAVHRLREVACLYGFTRFQPAPLANDDLEDVGLAVRGAAWSKPGMVASDRAVWRRHIHPVFDRRLAKWLSRPTVLENGARLQLVSECQARNVLRVARRHGWNCGCGFFSR